MIVLLNMILIIGLGNPGKKFENTRHNVGFIAIDKFAKINNFPDFVLQKKVNALVASASAKGFGETRENENIILAKPQTFMNESGKAVRALTKPYTLNPKPLLIVVHDDIDLPVGKIKIVQERGSAGHKGVESIIQNTGNEGLIRIRIGIASPAEALAKEGPEKKIKAIKVVLKNFSADEQKLIDQALEKTAEAIKCFIDNGLEKTMNEFNK